MNGLATPLWCLAALAALAPAQEKASTALAALRAGNQRFHVGAPAVHPLDGGRRRSLARGPQPRAIVLCCADSRVPPEHVFDAGLGELFVIRLAGNVLDAEGLASIESAASQFGTQLCVVLAHEGCGAVSACAAAVEAGDAAPPPAASPVLAGLLQRIEPAVQAARLQQFAGKELRDRAEAEHAQRTAAEVLRRSPELQQRMRSGAFCVVPARCDLDTGLVEWLPMPSAPDAGATASATHTVPPAIAPQVALSLLQAGHRRFLGDGPPLGDTSPARREAVALGQHPFAIVVTCADARVPPEHLFDAGLGDLFVVRIAGNVVNDDVVASIEYAAAHTGASLVLFLGHTDCDAVRAAAEPGRNAHPSPAMHALMERLQPAIAAAQADGDADPHFARAARTNAQRSLAEARRGSALLRRLEAEGNLMLTAAVYDLERGDLTWLSEDAPAHTAAACPAAPTGETAALPHAAAASPGAWAHAAEPPPGAPPAGPTSGLTAILASARELLFVAFGVAAAVAAALLLRRNAA